MNRIINRLHAKEKEASKIRFVGMYVKEEHGKSIVGRG